jgi:hypothetical protein
MSKPTIEWDHDLPVEAKQRRETFARFGLAMYHAQCVERQIGILLATTLNPDFLRSSQEERDRFFDVEFAKTLGRLVGVLGEKLTLNHSFIPACSAAFGFATGSRIVISGSALVHSLPIPGAIR